VSIATATSCNGNSGTSPLLVDVLVELDALDEVSGELLEVVLNVEKVEEEVTVALEVVEDVGVALVVLLNEVVVGVVIVVVEVAVVAVQAKEVVANMAAPYPPQDALTT
jgi:hypothetical protein